MKFLRMPSLIAILAILLPGVSPGAETNEDSVIVHALLRAEAETAETTLRELRAGRTSVATEMLEFQVDVFVITAWHRIQKHPEDADQDRVFLRQTKAYRAEYPRKKEAELDQSGTEFEKFRDNMIKEAQRILREEEF